MKDVKYYEGLYSVESDGTVRNTRWLTSRKQYSNRVLKPCKNRYGYNYVLLSKNNIVEQKLIHRLVAEAFIPNPDNLPYVNHINGDKADNRVENLEWVTAKQNVEHAISTGLRSKLVHKQPVKVTDIKTGKVTVYDSIQDVSKAYGKSNGYAKHILYHGSNRKKPNPGVGKLFLIERLGSMINANKENTDASKS